jgi:transporter family-2 protein
VTTFRMALLVGVGVFAGCLIAVQSVLNATLGQRTGTLGSVLLLTLVSLVTLVGLIVLLPHTADFRRIPGLSEWYLYVGGVLGVAILAAPIFLVPRIGVTLTLVAIVLGQMSLALVIDHYGLFATPKVPVSLPRILGIGLVAIGAFLVGR